MNLMSSSSGGKFEFQRCILIVGCVGPRQKGHRSTRSTHAPQTAWPQSTKATDFDAEQHSARCGDDLALQFIPQVLDAPIQIGQRI